jgi:hypothetical protein
MAARDSFKIMFGEKVSPPSVGNVSYETTAKLTITGAVLTNAGSYGCGG